MCLGSKSRASIRSAIMPTTEKAVPPNSSPTAADTPFVLTSTVKAKEGGLEKFLEFCAAVDKAVEDVETGMLMHTLNATDDPLTFTWMEVYQNDAAFHAHLGNPAVGELLAQAPEVLDGSMTLEIYGEIAPETKAFAEGLGMGLCSRSASLGSLARSLRVCCSVSTADRQPESSNDIWSE